MVERLCSCVRSGVFTFIPYSREGEGHQSAEWLEVRLLALEPIRNLLFRAMKVSAGRPQLDQRAIQKRHLPAVRQRSVVPVP